MFRALRKIIPFVNGRTAAFDWYTDNAALGRVIVAAAEDGVGVLSTSTQDFLWKVEGGTTITACLPVATSDGRGQVIIGGVDGFVASFALPDGKPLHRWRVGAPIVGLADLVEASVWVVVTRQGISALDADWNVKASFPIDAVSMCKTSGKQVTVACQNGSLVALTFAA